MYLLAASILFASLNAAAQILPLAASRIRFLRIDPKIFDRLLHNVDFELPLARQGIQRCEHDVLGIHFKEIAK